MLEIRTRQDSSETVKAEDFKGKRVLAKNGEEVGTISEIRIDPMKMTVAGIVINKGLFKEDHYVSHTFIHSMVPEGAVLSITPLTEFLGRTVFDAEGKKVGKVKELLRVGPTNRLASITIDRGFRKPDIVVPENNIEYMERNVVLTSAITEPVEGEKI